MGARQKRQKANVALAVGALLISTSGIQAATLQVDDSGGQPYTTIQSAIDAAVSGVDDVFVHCGVYNENVVMRDGVSVRGADPGCTIIDGGGSGSVVTIIDVGAATLLEGFTIRNGSSELGGGIFLETSALTVRGNVIESNSAVDSGSAGTGQGGGIHITTDLSLRAFTEPVITGNVIRGNTADTYGGGIALYIDDGATIRNNLIERNSAILAGGGIHAFTSYPDVVNNTIVRNCLQGAGTACSQGGGGIALTSSGVVDISNNVIAWNEAAARGGGVDMVGSTAAFLHNDVFGNTPANYFGVTDPTGSNGNISTDPLFADEHSTMAGYQPRSDSPLVDGGTSSLAPAADIRTIPRPMDGDAGGTAEHDIGARENEGATRLLLTSKDDLSWDPSIDSLAGFNLYRGELQVLRSTGVYTQDISTVPGAFRWCGLAASSESDTDSPGSDWEVWFYIAVVSGATEGTLGFDGSPGERPFTPANRCP